MQDEIDKLIRDIESDTVGFGDDLLSFPEAAVPSSANLVPATVPEVAQAETIQDISPPVNQDKTADVPELAIPDSGGRSADDLFVEPSPTVASNPSSSFVVPSGDSETVPETLEIPEQSVPVPASLPGEEPGPLEQAAQEVSPVTTSGRTDDRVIVPPPLPEQVVTGPVDPLASLPVNSVEPSVPTVVPETELPIPESSVPSVAATKGVVPPSPETIEAEPMAVSAPEDAIPVPIQMVTSPESQRFVSPSVPVTPPVRQNWEWTTDVSILSGKSVTGPSQMHEYFLNPEWKRSSLEIPDRTQFAPSESRTEMLMQVQEEIDRVAELLDGEGRL